MCGMCSLFSSCITLTGCRSCRTSSDQTATNNQRTPFNGPASLRYAQLPGLVSAPSTPRVQSFSPTRQLSPERKLSGTPKVFVPKIPVAVTEAETHHEEQHIGTLSTGTDDLLHLQCEASEHKLAEQASTEGQGAPQQFANNSIGRRLPHDGLHSLRLQLHMPALETDQHDFCLVHFADSCTVPLLNKNSCLLRQNLSPSLCLQMSPSRVSTTMPRPPPPAIEILSLCRCHCESNKHNTVLQVHWMAVLTTIRAHLLPYHTIPPKLPPP